MAGQQAIINEYQENDPSVTFVQGTGASNGWTQSTPNQYYSPGASTITAFIGKEIVAVTGGPTGGTFTLSHAGQVTSALAYNETAANVQAALQALANVGAGKATVSGPNGGPWTVTWDQSLFAGGTSFAAMTISNNSLTGGSGPTVLSGVGFEQTTTVVGNQVQFVTPVACHAIYLCAHLSNDQPLINVTVDGVSYGQLDLYNGIQAGGAFERVLTPLFRTAGPDALHTVTLTLLTAPSGNNKMAVDSFITVSYGADGGKGKPTPGSVVVVGASWTAGNGAANQRGGWAYRLASMLPQKLGRPINLVNKGVAGDRTYCYDGGHLGMMYRLALPDVAPNTPEILILSIEGNDTTNVSQPLPAGDLAKHVFYMLCFVEDALDVKQTKVVVCTPAYAAPAYLMDNYTNATVTMGSAQANLEQAAAVVRQVAALFPWVTVADVFAAMDYRSDLVYPNGAGDLGGHANDIGHGVIAVEVLRAIVGAAG